MMVMPPKLVESSILNGRKEPVDPIASPLIIYSLVTQNINSEDDEEQESYVINELLHGMLKVAPAPFNTSFFFQQKVKIFNLTLK